MVIDSEGLITTVDPVTTPSVGTGILVGGSATWGQSKPIWAQDADGFQCARFKTEQIHGFEVPADVPGGKDSVCAAIVIRPDWDRTSKTSETIMTVRRTLNFCGFTFSYTTTASNYTVGSPKLQDMLIDVPVLHSRSVIGIYRRGGTSRAYYNGVVYTLTSDDNGDQDGGSIGARDNWLTQQFAGQIYDIAGWFSNEITDMPADINDWIAMCDELMLEYEVTNHNERTTFIQATGDSNADLADGIASDPRGWADRFTNMGEVDFHCTAKAGWTMSNVLLNILDCQERVDGLGRDINIYWVIIGTNDLARAETAATLAGELETILKTARSAGFQYVVVGSIPPRGGYEDVAIAINNIIRDSNAHNHFVDHAKGMPDIMGEGVNHMTSIWNRNREDPTDTSEAHFTNKAHAIWSSFESGELTEFRENIRLEGVFATGAF